MSTPNLLAQLADLRSRLDALEGKSQRRSEAANPSYLTMDPATGLIGADFTGTVNAQGLDLEAGTTNSPPSASRVRWMRGGSGGALVANLLAARTDANPFFGSFMELEVLGEAAGYDASMQLTAREAGGGAQRADLQIVHGPDEGAGVDAIYAAATDAVNFQHRVKIIDSAGKSDLVLMTPGPGGGNTLSIEWTGVSLQFYVDATLVLTINANPFPRTI